MDAAKAGKPCLFQRRDHAEHLGLASVFHLGLEPHDVEQCPQLVVTAQLDDGIGLVLGRVGVGQADGFHRAKAQGFAAAFGHHLDGQAAVEIFRGLALVELCLVGGQRARR